MHLHLQEMKLIDKAIIGSSARPIIIWHYHLKALSNLCWDRLRFFLLTLEKAAHGLSYNLLLKIWNPWWCHYKTHICWRNDEGRRPNWQPETSMPLANLASFSVWPGRFSEKQQNIENSDNEDLTPSLNNTWEEGKRLANNILSVESYGSLMNLSLCLHRWECLSPCFSEVYCISL